jgi:hypothetical protein
MSYRSRRPRYKSISLARMPYMARLREQRFVWTVQQRWRQKGTRGMMRVAYSGFRMTWKRIHFKFPKMQTSTRATIGHPYDSYLDNSELEGDDQVNPLTSLDGVWILKSYGPCTIAIPNLYCWDAHALPHMTRFSGHTRQHMRV